MNAEQVEERYIRQKDIVPTERIAECKATVDIIVELEGLVA